MRRGCFRSSDVDASLVRLSARATFSCARISLRRAMRYRVLSVWGCAPSGHDTPPSSRCGSPAVVGSWLVWWVRCGLCLGGCGDSGDCRDESREEPAPHTPTTRTAAPPNTPHPHTHQHDLNISRAVVSDVHSLVRDRVLYRRGDSDEQCDVAVRHGVEMDDVQG